MRTDDERRQRYRAHSPETARERYRAYDRRIGIARAIMKNLGLPVRRGHELATIEAINKLLEGTGIQI